MELLMAMTTHISQLDEPFKTAESQQFAYIDGAAENRW